MIDLVPKTITEEIMHPIEQRNALIPKFNATRASRDRVARIAATAAHNLHEIAIACTADDDSFARMQSSALQSIAAAISRLPSIEGALEEISTLLPAIKTTWEA